MDQEASSYCLIYNFLLNRIYGWSGRQIIAKTTLCQYSHTEFMLFLHSACSKGNFVNQVKLGEQLNTDGYVSHSSIPYHP